MAGTLATLAPQIADVAQLADPALDIQDLKLLLDLGRFGPLAAAFRPSGRRRLSPLAHTVSAGDPLPAQRDALFWVSGRAPVVQLDRVISRLAGANAHYSIYRCDPYLAIANGPSTSMLGDRGYNAVGSTVRDNDVELDLG